MGGTEKFEVVKAEERFVVEARVRAGRLGGAEEDGERVEGEVFVRMGRERRGGLRLWVEEEGAEVERLEGRGGVASMKAMEGRRVSTTVKGGGGVGRGGVGARVGVETTFSSLEFVIGLTLPSTAGRRFDSARDSISSSPLLFCCFDFSARTTSTFVRPTPPLLETTAGTVTTAAAVAFAVMVRG